MAHYLVKCYSGQIGYKNILVEAHSKEEAKEYIKTTPLVAGGFHSNEVVLSLVPVGAREVQIVDGWKIFVKDSRRVHSEEVARNRLPEEKNFTVTFKAKKDGQVKQTVVKATGVREAKNKVKEFGTPLEAVLAKGQNRVGKTEKRTDNRNYKMIHGVQVYKVSHNELVEMTEKTKGWTTSYIETAGSVKSGMTRY